MSRAAGGFLMVRSGKLRVGLELTHVLEVIQIGAIHPVPTREAAVRGVADVRGRMIPVVHLGTLLQAGGGPSDTGDLVVVVTIEGRRLCLQIDDAEIVVRQAALPVPQGTSLSWAIGVARHPEGLVPVLDLAALSSRFVEAAPA
jgi:chemotaxis signal transduction protein